MTTILWLSAIVGILAAGVILGHVVYVVGGFIVDMLDDSIEHGDD